MEIKTTPNSSPFRIPETETFTKRDQFILERRKRIQDAYKMLPDSDGFSDGFKFKVPYVADGITDFYTFVHKNDRWVMEETELNRHLFRGIYI